MKSKANNTDLQKIYDLKLNKSDISVMISSIDNMHKQLSYSSVFTLNVIKLINESNLFKNDGRDRDRDRDNINMLNLLKSAYHVNQWITNTS